MLRKLLAVSLFVCMAVSSAHAELFTASPATFQQPDLVSFGLGYMNFDKSQPMRKTVDFRGEYRWGLSILPIISPYFRHWDPYVQFHPWAGVETTSFGQLYGVGGFAMDWYMTHHLVLTWSEGAGLYYPGEAVRLGSFVEFRSEAEFGYRFDNGVRLTAELSHISNAKITKFNPGAEIAGVYLHMPVSQIFGTGSSTNSNGTVPTIF